MTGRGWIILVALGAVLPASAQWQLIDDFLGWLYMQEPAYDAPGAWAYFFK